MLTCNVGDFPVANAASLAWMADSSSVSSFGARTKSTILPLVVSPVTRPGKKQDRIRAEVAFSHATDARCLMAASSSQRLVNLGVPRRLGTVEDHAVFCPLADGADLVVLGVRDA